MKLTAGEVVTIKVNDSVLSLKIEDASKGDVISGRVESVISGDIYSVGQICEFERSQIQVDEK